VALRTFGSEKVQLNGWVVASSKYSTWCTGAYKSTFSPILVQAVDDTEDAIFLEKINMPTLHLLLAVNNILRPHLVNFFDSEEQLLEILRCKMGTTATRAKIGLLRDHSAKKS
jgi:hypothetical protein